MDKQTQFLLYHTKVVIIKWNLSLQTWRTDDSQYSGLLKENVSEFRHSLNQFSISREKVSCPYGSNYYRKLMDYQKMLEQV